MKYITFKNIIIKNFLSVGETPVEVSFNSGLNIITGINKDKVDRRNGVGKSTIADALYFAVFGETLRELKKEFVSNNVTGKGAEVVLNFTVSHMGKLTHYRIVRTLSPSKIYIYKDDIDVTRDSISNTNTYISEIINSSPEVFQNCIIMTVNNATPFMEKKKTDKRKFIEGILNLEVFSRMINNIRSEYSDVNAKFNIECSRFEEASTNLTSFIDKKEQSDSAKLRYVEELDNRLKTNKTKLTSLVADLDAIVIPDVTEITTEIETLKNKNNEFQKTVVTLTKAVTQKETDIVHLKRMLNSIGVDGSKCPKCLRLMEEHDKELIETEKADIIAKIESNNKDIKKLEAANITLDEKIQVISNNIRSLQAEVNDSKVKQANISHIKKSIKDVRDSCLQIEEDIKESNEAKCQFESLIEETEAKMSNIQKDIDIIKEDMHILDVVKFVVSEEGVKSYIVKKILQLLNSKLAYYLKKMDSNCMCIFNEYFEEQIIDERGKICSYHNFSGAERKNIDFACMFAFMDLRRLQGDVAFNFCLYDELFDSSVDEKGIELITNVLKERIEQYNECVMVISHRKESVKLADGEIIFLEKENGITKRVENPTIST